MAMNLRLDEQDSALLKALAEAEHVSRHEAALRAIRRSPREIAHTERAGGRGHDRDAGPLGRGAGPAWPRVSGTAQAVEYLSLEDLLGLVKALEPFGQLSRSVIEQALHRGRHWYVLAQVRRGERLIVVLYHGQHAGPGRAGHVAGRVVGPPLRHLQ